MSWTEDQSKAIHARGCNLAVSAAAGSGKTAVLTHRILSLLMEPDGIDASRLVVVTFTKAAARELEDRLYSILSQMASGPEASPHMTRQLFSLSRARISTIHSFAYSLICEHRKELGLGEGVRILTPEEASLLQAEAAKGAVERFLAEGDESETKERLFSLFENQKGADGLRDVILRLQKLTANHPDGTDFLRRAQEKLVALCDELLRDPSAMRKEGAFGAEIFRFALEKLDTALAVIDFLCDALSSGTEVAPHYLPFLEQVKKGIVASRDRIRSGKSDRLEEELLSFLRRESVPSHFTAKNEGDLRALCRDSYHRFIKEPLLFLGDELLCEDRSLTREDLLQTTRLLSSLLSLSADFEASYAGEKRKKGVLDYNDLEHMALSLFVEKDENGAWRPLPLAETVAAEFDAIFVDEYQDTNAVQDLLFRTLSRGDNLFVVGDPKQSIYRFRGANPEIFARYKNDLPLYPSPEGEMQKIFLSNNFRCDPSVIDLVNRVFRVIMDETDPQSLYREQDRLVHSKIDLPGAIHYPAELVLVEKGEGLPEGANAVAAEENLESSYLAGRILSLLSGKEEKEKGVPYSPGDIAVICRSHRQIARVKAALEKRGIPCITEKGNPISEDPEFLFVSSLLSALDNPTRDIPLLGALSSPVFRFSPDALYRIRLHSQKGSFYHAMVRYAETGEHEETAERCKSTLALFARLRAEAADVPLTAFLFSLYRRFGIEILYAKTSSRVKEALFAAAKEAQSSAKISLSSFCRRLSTLTLAAPDEGEGVQLLTIHKSKGLEFPVVFVSFLAQAFSHDDESASLIVTDAFGAAMTVVGEDARVRRNTLLRKASALRLHRDLVEEEMRVLYVAMTRARQRLILTAVKGKTETLKKEILFAHDAPLSPELTRLLVKGAKNALTFLTLALRRDKAFRAALESGGTQREGNLTVSVSSPDPLATWEKKEEKKPFCDADPQTVLDALSFVYEEKGLEELPEKLSVSEILREEREDAAPEFFPHRLMDFESGTLRSGAEAIGTATHKVMQFADFERMEKDPDGEWKRLLEKGFLSPEEMDLVEKDKVLAFFSSPLYDRIRRSPEVEHEKRWAVLLDAKELGVGDRGEVLVQGVVDVWFENPDGTLTIADFKTDRVNKKDGADLLCARHGRQLRLYAQAVSKITGKRVTALCLYSFHLGKEIPVPLQ